jgi:proteasome lid subunit RPN8/RPN11
MIHKQIAEICENLPQEESCGFLLYKQKKFFVKQCENKAEDKARYFKIDPFDYVNAFKKYKILMCYHSHVLGDESPSDYDIKYSEEMLMPLYIYSTVTKKYKIHYPQKLRMYKNLKLLTESKVKLCIL